MKSDSISENSRHTTTISGITLVGAISCAVADYPQMGEILGFFAITLATVNVVGGFAVTDRMLGMFASKNSKKKGD